MSVPEQTILETIQKYVGEELLAGKNAVELGPHEDLLEDSLVDSLGIMRLVAFIADHYGVTVPPQDVTIENFATIQTIVDYLSPRLSDHVE